MVRLPALTPRLALIIAHDLLATAVALLVSVYVRDDAGFTERLAGLLIFLPGFLVYAAIVYFFLRVSETKWRFVSLPDLYNIARAATVLALSLLVLDYILVANYFYGTFFFGKITIALYWLLQMFLLSGSRIAYRYFRYTRTRQRTTAQGALPTIIIGNAADVEVLLRAIESGAVKKVMPVGVLSPSPADQGQGIRGVPILGRPEDLERVICDFTARAVHVVRLILTSSAFDPSAEPAGVLRVARRLGLAASRLPSLERDELPPQFSLAPINIEDLLLRPSVNIDYQRLENFVRGRTVLVTGGGGSIGSEICDRVMHFGASKLLILENSELALHTVLERLKANAPDAPIEGRLANIRNRDRMFQLIGAFKPDIVFHAAALKHVPLLETEWVEGIKTNVFGSVNVVDASLAAAASAIVMISTDKAIEPVSVLGATKRLAEMYSQALDAQQAGNAAGSRTTSRLVAVRFGNVLASNGSVVPKFKSQIETGGPITVTHPEMVRYFMTIREACDLVITAATHALEHSKPDVSVYVLDMGQPVRILDLAERLVRLAGLEPGRDIEIVFTGQRPGERLNEILFAKDETRAEIGIGGISASRPVCPSIEGVRNWLTMLQQAITRDDRVEAFNVLRNAVPGFYDQHVRSSRHEA